MSLPAEKRDAFNKRIIENLRFLFENSSPEERVSFLNIITKGFCKECGKADNDCGCL